MTGHTGFKGSWLAFWLLHLGAAVKGLSLAPNTTPALAELVARLIASWQPDVVFHLAAQ
nr:hypothetical protein [Microcystis aeruginosa]